MRYMAFSSGPAVRKPGDARGLTTSFRFRAFPDGGELTTP